MNLPPPHYYAPELIRGEQLDARTDVYALGCVLYESLTGRPPYSEHEGMRVLWAHIYEPPPRVSEHAPRLPHELDDVVSRAMAKEPGERYASAGELGRAALAAAALAAPG